MTGSNCQGKRQALLAAFDRLDEAQQEALMDFAAVLAVRDDGSAKDVMRPEPRPADESVVAAIRRLTRSHPTAERRRLMGPLSMLMAQHALRGRAAEEVIDEIEAVFERQHVKTARNNEQ